MCQRSIIFSICLHNDSSCSQRALHLHNTNWTLSTHRTTESRPTMSRPTLKWLPFNAMNWVSSAKYAFVPMVCVYTQNHHKSTSSLMTTTFFKYHICGHAAIHSEDLRPVLSIVNTQAKDTHSYCNIDGQWNWMQIYKVLYFFLFWNLYFGLARPDALSAMRES